MKRVFVALIACAFSGVLTTQGQSNYEPYSITTFAGIAPFTDPGSDGTGSSAHFAAPAGMALDGAGNIYVADSGNQTIRKVTPSGVVSTIAGLAGNQGSDDGVSCAARFYAPTGVAVDSAGNAYVADTNNSTIRKITPDGVVSTLAGLAGSWGSSDGAGSGARFFFPTGVAVDNAGNVYVADSYNHTIRKVTPAGVVSTLAGLHGNIGSADGAGSAARFYEPVGVAVDSAGNVYVADTQNHTIRKITPAGVVSTLAGLAGNIGSADGAGSAARFYNPRDLGVDSTGDVYVADTVNSTIRKVSPAGVVSTLAGLPGSLGSADGTGSAARFHNPEGVAVGSVGKIYVADTYNFTIRKITPDGVVNTLAGVAASYGSDDGTGGAARFYQPVGAAVDSAGNLYVADTYNCTIRKITPDGVVSTLAGLAARAGSDDGAGSAARFFYPEGVAVDSAGDVYVADMYNHTIRKITPAGVVSTLAGLAGSYGSADGTGSAARFFYPEGVAVDSAGDVYVADMYNHTIRKITPAGVVSTLAGLAGSQGSADGTGSAARFSYPEGVAVDSAGNIYVADSNNHTIRKITPSGVVNTLAGVAGNSGSNDGTGSVARFYYPGGLVVDSAGNVYLADSGNYTIRKITPAGVVSTLAGLAGSEGSADGTGSAARFSAPFFFGGQGVAVNSAGNVYVADSGNNTIRVGAKAPPLITTVGQNFTYWIETNGAILIMVSNLPPGLSFDPQLNSIRGVPTTAGTFQVEISTYPGFATHTPLTIIVQPEPVSSPVITSGTSATGRVSRLFSFQVATTGGTTAARLSASGLPPGLSADPVSGVISGKAAAAGTSIATLTVTDGSFTSIATLQLTFTTDRGLPVILNSSTAVVTPGQPFSYTIIAPTGCGSPGVPTFTLSGDLPQGLSFDEATGTISGIYPGPLQREKGGGPSRPELAGGALLASVQLFGTNISGTATFELLLLVASSGAVNVSTRLPVGTGDNVLIGGFVITGNAPEVVIVRAIGPSLGIPGLLDDPMLELHDSAGHVVANNNWRDTQEDLIVAANIAPADYRESTIIAGLDPGAYTAIVTGGNGAAGVALVEVYDFGTASVDTSGRARLTNLSTRGFVETGDNVMIGGFIIRSESTRVIMRGIGPSLGAFGVPNALQDTVLELRDSNGTTLMSNDNWQDDPAQAAEITAAGLAPGDNLESAIVATLNPGGYTGIVRGKNKTTGVALVEVYGLQ